MSDVLKKMMKKKKGSFESLRHLQRGVVMQSRRGDQDKDQKTKGKDGKRSTTDLKVCDLSVVL